jgi:aminoglycoside phosphotransferase (APT) family kinase protein
MADDVPGIPDSQALRRWLTDEARVPGKLVGATLIAGGRSNLTYLLDLGETRLVLRRPPLGHVLPTAHDMSREYRTISALTGTDVPVPTPIAFCSDNEVIGAPFYLMAEVRGTVLRTVDDARAALTPAAAAHLSGELVRTLAAIHAADTSRLGTPRPGYLRRQLDRWQRQWELSATRDVPGYSELVVRLEAGLPDDGEVRLVHGDFRLDNTIVTLAPPRIAAVVDWEMSTLGDPLADLGLTLTYWTLNDELMPLGQPTAADGFATGAEFAAAYGAATGRDVSGLGYYIAFGCFKLAVVLEGINARYLKHLTVGEGFEREGAAVPILIARAHQALDGQLLPGLGHPARRPAPSANWLPRSPSGRVKALRPAFAEPHP